LRQAAALAPDSAAAHTFLGLHYERLGDASSARAEYEAAYDLDPDNPATCVEIGQTWAAEGRYTEAEIWLREAVSLRPDDPALWQVLARFYLDHNITAAGRGVEAAAKLLQLLPDDARAHDLRGWAAFQVGDYEQAEESFLRAVALDPSLAAVHYHLGLLWTVRGWHQDAQEAFTRALDLDTTGKFAPFIERTMEGNP
jgi:Flp pilus assembly protein TadD